MNHTALTKAAQAAAENRRHRHWRQTVTGLGAVVVFITTYMLILPAITMERETLCGLDEHTHTDACYELQLTCGLEEGQDVLLSGHAHGDGCYTYICGQEEHDAHTHTDADCYGDVEVLSCGQEEHDAHTHTDADCYSDVQVLSCGQEEHDAHAHGPSCYTTEDVLSCGQEESDGHAHDDSCYSQESFLDCSEEHEHSDDCYGVRDVLSCGQTASEGHSHDGSCYTQHSSLTCGQEASEGHAHSDACYALEHQLTCTAEESEGHTHTDACRTMEHQLLCTTPESEGHSHTDDCRVLTCDLEESELVYAPHVHTEDCYSLVLVCQLPEHTHEDACFAPEVSQQPQLPAESQYICGLEEHTHDESCLDENGELTCGLEEHTHDETCAPAQQPQLPAESQYTCGLEEHTHDESCLDENGELTCGLEEHTHDETCLPPAQPVLTEQTLTAELYTDETYSETYDGGTVITVSGMLPENAQLRAFPADVNVPGMQVLCAYDITIFLPDGTVYEPTEPVNVRFQLPEQDAPATLDMMEGETEQPLEEEVPEESVDYTVYYLPDEGEPEAMDTVTHKDGATFTAGHFSTYAMTRSISFTVEHWANLDQVDYNASSGTLKIIDTSGKNLPKNGQVITPLYITLNGDGSIKTKTELVKIYADESYIYSDKLNAGNTQQQNLANINKLAKNKNYTLKTVKVSQDGGANWTDYDPANVLFSEDVSTDANVVQIRQGTKIKLIYDPKSSSQNLNANFYDYDITSKLNTTSNRYESGIVGINSRANYPSKSANGVRTYDSGCDILAFGNQNCGTGMGGYLFDGGYLNGYNNRNSDYASSNNRYNGTQTGASGCTFDLVRGLDSDGNIIWNPWLLAPNLFNDGDAIGKHTYSDSTLTFSQSGDAHTLSSAAVNGAGTVSRLDKFNNPVCGTTTYSHIWTNNFWPMDSVPAANRTDPLMGKTTKTGENEASQGVFQGFKNYALQDVINKDSAVNVLSTAKWEGWNGYFPKSDDGQAHNCFFGLNFALNFDLSKDYIGPLDYLFFGDDDMWVFLTDSDGNSTLVCDIGGVHSSVGEYVNLWDYIKREGRTENETYTLTFFYTERGASGSTCYMRFTLPSVSTATTTMDTGSVEISKTVESTLSSDMDKEFTFQLELPGSGSYPYTTKDGKTGSVKSGDTITLKHNEAITISGILAGRTVTVTEQGAEQYVTIVGGEETKIGSATIKTDDTAEIAFINRAGAALPETGGPGVHGIVLLGTALSTCALALLLRRRKGAYGC